MTARDEVELRKPPNSAEAEQSVLGGLLLDNGAFDRVGDLLEARDFYRSEHRAIFEAVVQLVEASKPADVVTVYERLQRAGRAEDCGGMEYLDALARSVPSAANARRYAEIVREHAEARAVIAAVDEAAAIAWTAETSPADKRDRIGAVLARLEGRAVGREPRAIGDLVAARLDHYSALAEGTEAPGIPTGLRTLDRALGGGLKPGKLVVLGARPTIGKTSLAGQISGTVAAAGHATLILSQEMTAGELVDRFIANTAGVQLEALTSGRLEDADWGNLSSGADRLAASALFVDDSPALNLQQIRAKARQVRRRHGLALVVVDYLQLCSSATPTERRHHQIEAISRGLKQLAKELATCVIVLSQLGRASLDRPDSEPEMSDLKESGAIEEDADVVLLLHPTGRQEPDGSALMLLKLAKNRQGRRGRIALAFDGRLQRWAESESDVSRRRGKGDE
ncbi:replicative DNA helicase [Piscinibacter defluvii]|uniref:replicative DNA helicase n=1 Tax=Piscinibacter defluvii TaxID=1796922 RepID=UPI0013E2EC7D|nr:replicative DNA helicase [Piscinibacter defluvii]